MIIFIAFSVIHIAFFVWIHHHWRRIKPVKGPSKKEFTFSVVVPVRNEAANILNLLGDLENQEYPRDLIEVVIVDDNSEDDTLHISEDFLNKSSINFQIIDLSQLGRKGKKSAITVGVKAAKHDIILATDGDCRLTREWVSGYNEAYSQGEAMMITGPVRMEGSGLFERIQSYEFSALIGVGAASLQSGNPGMCNGANLSYRKELFHEVNGYDGNSHIPSGDDEFLLQRAYHRYPESVFFLKDERSIVTTGAKPSLGDLINQRVRWSSKWRFHKSYFIRLTAIVVFFDFASLIYAFFSGLTSPTQSLIFWTVFIIRWSSVYLLTYSVCRFLKLKKLFFASLAGEIIYPFFVIFLGLASIFGKYSWKGRQYK